MVDAILYRKLLLLKSFFEHGKSHSSYKTHLDNMLAIHHFDLCNEFMLRILSDKLKINVDKLVVLENIYDCINKNLEKKESKKLGFKKEILRVRKLRNDIQHQAETKTGEDADISFVHTNDFLNQTISDIFGIDFESLSLSDLIQNEEYRKNIKNAESLLNKGKKIDALKLIDLIFTTKLDELKKDIYKPSGSDLLGFSRSIGGIGSLGYMDYRSVPSFTSFGRDNAFRELSDAINNNRNNMKEIAEKILEAVDRKFEEYTRNIVDTLSIFWLGVDYRKYSKYKDIVWTSRFEEVPPQDVEFALEFVTDFLIKH